MIWLSNKPPLFEVFEALQLTLFYNMQSSDGTVFRCFANYRVSPVLGGHVAPSICCLVSAI